MVRSVLPVENGTISLPCVSPQHDQDPKDSKHNNDPNGNSSNRNLSDRNTENLDRNKMADDNKCTNSITKMTTTHSNMTLKL